MSCQARVITDPITIPSCTTPFYNTEECGATSFKRIVVDDGDAEMHICSRCLVRFLGKAKADSKWHGWFDCDIPPASPVRGSKSFWAAVTEAYLTENPSAQCKTFTPGFLNNWLASKKPLPPSVPSTGSSSPSTPAALQAPPTLQPSPTIKEQIAAIKAWLDGPGKTAPLKEQVAKHKEIYQLKLSKKKATN